MEKRSTDTLGKTMYTRDELHKNLIEAASLSPAKKRKVGAAIVRLGAGRDGGSDLYEIISYGYNFNPSGGPCETADHTTHVDVVHAEVAAIMNLPSGFNCGYPGVIRLYTTHDPCDGCKAAMLERNLEWEVIGDFLKFDSDKPRYDLVPTEAVAAMARVLTYGAKKYKPNNWRKTVEPERYIAAAMRHLDAYRSGELVDPESGPAKLKHIEQVLTNVAFLIALNHEPEKLSDIQA